MERLKNYNTKNTPPVSSREGFNQLYKLFSACINIIAYVKLTPTPFDAGATNKFISTIIVYHMYRPLTTILGRVLSRRQATAS